MSQFSISIIFIVFTKWFGKYHEKTTTNWCFCEIVLFTTLRLRFYCKRSTYETGRHFIMKSRDFHDDRLGFYNKRLSFYWWQVEIFMMTGQDFYNHRSRFCYEWSRFSWYQVEIFMMTGWDSHYDRSRFSLW